MRTNQPHPQPQDPRLLSIFDGQSIISTMAIGTGQQAANRQVSPMGNSWTALVDTLVVEECLKKYCVDKYTKNKSFDYSSESIEKFLLRLTDFRMAPVNRKVSYFPLGDARSVNKGGDKDQEHTEKQVTRRFFKFPPIDICKLLFVQGHGTEHPKWKPEYWGKMWRDRSQEYINDLFLFWGKVLAIERDMGMKLVCTAECVDKLRDYLQQNTEFSI
jgi:hypothetical protein